MTSKILQQGAEAIISLNSKNQIEKNRVKKSYRFSLLDKKIRKQRTKSEAKILIKASQIIPVPKLISSTETDLVIEYIKGKKLSENLDELKNQIQIAEKIGKQIALLHNNNIIHGDLTTSNMIYVDKNTNNQKDTKNNSLINNKTQISDNNSPQFKLYFIDFGLSFHSHRPEDFAVDLHLISQALEAKHFKNHKSLFSSVLKGYKSISNQAQQVLKRLEKVQSRGRYKTQY